jgi:phosphoribosylaminoimidazole-succinocarboxamide synthase
MSTAHDVNGTGRSHTGTPDLGLELLRSGKVREVYTLADRPDALLLVASDRISAFDVIMPTLIPGKGRILTQMSTFWFDFIAATRLAQTHVISTNLRDLPASALPKDPAARAWLDGRFTLARACEVIPIECVVRGYLEGSGWKEYQTTGTVCGVKLPAGLKQCDKLPEPIFTPATKAATGHDENITFEEAAERVGLETIATLRDLSLKIYAAAAEHALSRGIIIADTKFEFGRTCEDGAKLNRVWSDPILIDEALTPDSSRFWPADTYRPGGPQKSYDKQFLREYLEELVSRGAWGKSPPGPELPPAVVEGTLGRYREALQRLTSP